jgi:hypothetical protein
MMASFELGAIRSRAGRTDSDRESIGGILDKQSVDLGVRKTGSADCRNERGEHRFKRAEVTSMRLSNVVPARILRHKHAV